MGFCTNCGQPLKDGALFCTSCGKKVAATNSGIRDDAMAQLLSNQKQSRSSYATAAPIVKKHSALKIVLLVVAGCVLLFFLFIGIFSYEYNKGIRMVQRGTLQKYDYGINIGDALDQWFSGNVEWETYVKNGETYVKASGVTSHTIMDESEWQAFYFRILGDDSFAFDGAYNQDGDEIYTTTGVGVVDQYGAMVNELSQMLGGSSTYEAALEAAFGNQEKLDALEK